MDEADGATNLTSRKAQSLPDPESVQPKLAQALELVYNSVALGYISASENNEGQRWPTLKCVHTRMH